MSCLRRQPPGPSPGWRRWPCRAPGRKPCGSWCLSPSAGHCRQQKSPGQPLLGGRGDEQQSHSPGRSPKGLPWKSRLIKIFLADVHKPYWCYHSAVPFQTPVPGCGCIATSDVHGATGSEEGLTADYGLGCESVTPPDPMYKH